MLVYLTQLLFQLSAYYYFLFKEIKRPYPFIPGPNNCTGTYMEDLLVGDLSGANNPAPREVDQEPFRARLSVM